MQQACIPVPRGARVRPAAAELDRRRGRLLAFADAPGVEGLVHGDPAVADGDPGVHQTLEPSAGQRELAGAVHLDLAVAAQNPARLVALLLEVGNLAAAGGSGELIDQVLRRLLRDALGASPAALPRSALSRRHGITTSQRPSCRVVSACASAGPASAAHSAVQRANDLGMVWVFVCSRGWNNSRLPRSFHQPGTGPALRPTKGHGQTTKGVHRRKPLM